MKRSELLIDPFQQFDNWYQSAKEKGEDDVDAMAMATVGKLGAPSLRVVLYKGYNEQGFYIYTNYASRKAHELDENPFAAIVFYWPQSYRQVRVEGEVCKLTHKDSEAYFKTRPRDSQLGAWCSKQSSVIDSRETLETAFKELEYRFKDQSIPCPKFWGGYLLKANSFEFWQGQPHRLHDRFRYTLRGGGWEIDRLAP